MRMSAGVVLSLVTLSAGAASVFLWHFGVPTRDRDLAALVLDGPVETHVSVEVGRLLTMVNSGPAWFPASLLIPIVACTLVCGFVFLVHSVGWKFSSADRPFEGSVSSFSIFVGFGLLAGILLGAIGVVARPVSRGLALTTEDSATARIASWGLLNQSPWLFFISSVAVWVCCSFLAAFATSALGCKLTKEHLAR